MSIIRWEYHPKETQCEQEQELVCIASVETLYEINEDPNYPDTK